MSVVYLGGISLSDDLRLTKFKNQARIAGSVRPTLGGRMVAQNTPMSGGRALVLESFRSGDSVYGSFTGSQIDQIAALRDAGNPVSLVHHLGTFTVIIQSLDVEDLFGVSDPSSTDEYSGTITMIEV